MVIGAGSWRTPCSAGVRMAAWIRIDLGVAAGADDRDCPRPTARSQAAGIRPGGERGRAPDGRDPPRTTSCAPGRHTPPRRGARRDPRAPRRSWLRTPSGASAGADRALRERERPAGDAASTGRARAPCWRSPIGGCCGAGRRSRRAWLGPVRDVPRQPRDHRLAVTPPRLAYALPAGVASSSPRGAYRGRDERHVRGAGVAHRRLDGDLATRIGSLWH